MKKHQGIWITYDLGLKGDYSGLYTWLDNNKARDCGNGVAFFVYQYDVSIEKELKEEISKNVKLDINDRIYLIFRQDKSKKFSGKFLFGGRKKSPWEGFGGSTEQISMDNNE